MFREIYVWKGFIKKYTCYCRTVKNIVIDAICFLSAVSEL